MSIKVLIADDVEFMRRAIRRVLDNRPEVTVVGEAAGFAETILLANNLKPDLIVLDLHMPDEAGPGLLQIRSHLDGALLVATSVWSDSATKALADNIGADLFLDKASLGTKLLPAIVQLTSPNRNRLARAGQPRSADS